MAAGLHRRRRPPLGRLPVAWWLVSQRHVGWWWSRPARGRFRSPDGLGLANEHIRAAQPLDNGDQRGRSADHCEHIREGGADLEHRDADHEGAGLGREHVGGYVVDAQCDDGLEGAYAAVATHAGAGFHLGAEVAVKECQQRQAEHQAGVAMRGGRYTAETHDHGGPVAGVIEEVAPGAGAVAEACDEAVESVHEAVSYDQTHGDQEVARLAIGAQVGRARQRCYGEAAGGKHIRVGAA